MDKPRAVLSAHGHRFERGAKIGASFKSINWQPLAAFVSFLLRKQARTVADAMDVITSGQSTSATAYC
ncbi:hypothetical protein QKW52_14435 [Bacillus sonorensis]|nr:hypothetical protein [Bacillus sonorensis]TWK79277.1 hypothetical protein CHCC20335_0054 [Bacillus paralicheniformis]